MWYGIEYWYCYKLRFLWSLETGIIDHVADNLVLLCFPVWLQARVEAGPGFQEPWFAGGLVLNTLANVLGSSVFWTVALVSHRMVSSHAHIANNLAYASIHAC